MINITLPTGIANVPLNDTPFLPTVKSVLNKIPKISKASLMFPESIDQPCAHEQFDKYGVCEDCGFECVDHDWDKGQCKICGIECDHFDHDGHECLDCGMEYHEFANFDDYGDND